MTCDCAALGTDPALTPSHTGAVSGQRESGFCHLFEVDGTRLGKRSGGLADSTSGYYLSTLSG